MKNRIFRTITAMALVVSTMIFMPGCATSVNAKTNKDSKTYKSDQGWTIKYDPSIVTVKENDDSTSFVYTGSGTHDEMLTISFRHGLTPEEAVDAVAAGWPGASSSSYQLYKSESYFPGSNEGWGYWRSLLPDNRLNISEDAFAGEYNGGVLIFDMASRTSDNGWKVLQNVMDSITYDSFAPQTMYEGIAGTYVMNGTEMINGKEVPVTYSIVLDNDHQGTIKLLGDEQYVMWGTHNLIQADNSYDYSVDGHTLTLDLDGSQLIFAKLA